MANLNLELYNNVSEFNTQIDELKKEVKGIKLDDHYSNIIKKLKDKEQEIYVILGGNETEGKKAMMALADTIFINNKTRAEVIEIINNLFYPIVEEDGKRITFGKVDKKYAIKVDDKIEKNDAQNYFEKYCKKWNESVAKYNEYIKTIKNSMLAEGIIEKKSIETIENSFEEISKTLKNVEKGEVTITNLPKSFKDEKERLAGIFSNLAGKVTEGAKIDYNNKVLQEIISTVVNSGGDFIYEHTATIGNDQIKGKSPDDFTDNEKKIARAYRNKVTDFDKDPKADLTITLKGELHTPEAITIPATLKYTSKNHIKTHSGSLSSISDIISNEGADGKKAAEIFRKIAINMVYWIHFSEKESSEIILILKTILNYFAFSFIYGTGEKDKPYGNALFFVGFFKDVHKKDTYENYFTPVSNILDQIYSYISDSVKINQDNFALTWEGFNSLDKIKLIKKIDTKRKKIRHGKVVAEEIYSGELLDERLLSTQNRNFKNIGDHYDPDNRIISRQRYEETRKLIAREREEAHIKLEEINVKNFFDEISSLIGTRGIIYNRGIITGEEGELYHVFNFDAKTSGGIIL